MTLDPRTQLAQTMLIGLANQNHPRTRKKPVPAHERDGRQLERERQSMEALMQALLDPCATVQEARQMSLVQDADVDVTARNTQDRTVG
jgi:hypothetical protein